MSSRTVAYTIRAIIITTRVYKKSQLNYWDMQRANSHLTALV